MRTLRSCLVTGAVFPGGARLGVAGEAGVRAWLGASVGLGVAGGGGGPRVAGKAGVRGLGGLTRLASSGRRWT